MIFGNANPLPPGLGVLVRVVEGGIQNGGERLGHQKVQGGVNF